MGETSSAFHHRSWSILRLAGVAGLALIVGAAAAPFGADHDVPLARQALPAIAPVVEDSEAARAILALVAENERLRERVVELDAGLVRAERAASQAAAAHEFLVERLALIESATGQTAPAERQVALAERARLAVAQDHVRSQRLAAHVIETEALERLVGIIGGESGLVADMAERTRQGIERLRRVVAATGISADRMLALGDANGLGGPFVPPSDVTPSTVALAELGAELGRLESLRRLVRALPLAPPLERYTVISPFGVRRDPFHGGLARHEGLDLIAVYAADVAATAAGVVTFAGRAGDYGNLVEIDHGFGLRTRYAHLLRIAVRQGDGVALGQTIGRLGSSGRSTGPHVHYEVLIDGKPIDPARFLALGPRVVKL